MQKSINQPFRGIGSRHWGKKERKAMLFEGVKLNDGSSDHIETYMITGVLS